jgi:hypothetical protein
MEHMTKTPVAAALATLIILQALMLMALFAGVAPHPPAAVAPFGIGPFVGVALSVAVSALIMGPSATRIGLGLAVFAALLGLVSFGPQKYFDPQFPLIWPAVITAQIAIVTIFVQAAKQFRQEPALH